MHGMNSAKVVKYIVHSWLVDVIYRVIRNDCWGFNNSHLVLQMQPHVISFYGVT